MSTEHAACHVAEIRRTHGDHTYRYHFLRRTFREDGRVKHETLANLSQLPPEAIDAVRRTLKGERLVGATEAMKITRTLPHGHVAAVVGTLRRLRIPDLISSERSRMRDLCEALIAARILMPSSKLATARSLRRATAQSSLGDVLSLGSINEDDLYEAMDWLVARQRDIERGLAKRHLGSGAPALYDLTSAYFHGRTCPLAKIGYSRDGRKDRPQIEFGLLCALNGLPVAVDVFAGNTGDSKTVAPQVKKIREDFGLDRVIMVGDRGMITGPRIREDLPGLAWITALTATSIRGLVRRGSLQLGLFDERDLAEIQDAEFPGERLIVCRNPLLAAERARKRDELLAATERDLAKLQDATKRPRRPLRGAAQIGIRAGRVLNRYRVAKHFVIEIREDSFIYRRNTERIEEEARVDGIYVLRSNVSAETLCAAEVVRTYKGLTRVERAFRCIKGDDLKVRPIRHHTETRVRAHIFLCVLAYYVEWHMREALAPLLFQDHEKPSGEATRESPVAPAVRSPAATEKARTKQTAGGEPVHSFKTLLADLSTVAINWATPKISHELPPFPLITQPTDLQQKAFDLLKVPYLP